MKSIFKKINVGVIVGILVLGSVIASGQKADAQTVTSPMTAAQTQALIAQLTAQLAQLQAQLNALLAAQQDNTAISVTLDTSTFVQGEDQTIRWSRYDGDFDYYTVHLGNHLVPGNTESLSVKGQQSIAIFKNKTSVTIDGRNLSDTLISSWLSDSNYTVSEQNLRNNFYIIVRAETDSTKSGLVAQGVSQTISIVQKQDLQAMVHVSQNERQLESFGKGPIFLEWPSLGSNARYTLSYETFDEASGTIVVITSAQGGCNDDAWCQYSWEPNFTAGGMKVIVTDSVSKKQLVSRNFDNAQAQRSANIWLQGSPNLTLTYDSSRKESSLVGSAIITVTAGSDAVKIYEHNIGLQLNDTRSPQNISLNSTRRDVTTTVQAKRQDNLGTYYLVPAQSTHTFTVTATHNPQELFAGSYFVSPYLTIVDVDGSSRQIALDAKGGTQNSNSVVVSGETSPYISYVNSKLWSTARTNIQQNALLDFEGVRMNNARVLIDNKELDPAQVMVDTAGTKVYFNIGNLSVGSHTVELVTASGKSNKVNITVTRSNSSVPSTTTTTVPVVTEPAPVVTTTVSLTKPIITKVTSYPQGTADQIFTVIPGQKAFVIGREMLNIKQFIFVSSDGTTRSRTISGQTAKTSFSFTMPNLAAGTYMFTVVKEDGTMSESVSVTVEPKTSYANDSLLASVVMQPKMFLSAVSSGWDLIFDVLVARGW